MSRWKDKSCVPSATVEVLSEAEISDALHDIPGWAVTPDGKRISRSWRVASFVEALRFFNTVAELAENENHHPDLHVVGYRHVTIELWTHVVNGLSVNDLIVAAKINEIPVGLQAACD